MKININFLNFKHDRVFNAKYFALLLDNLANLSKLSNLFNKFAPIRWVFKLNRKLKGIKLNCFRDKLGHSWIDPYATNGIIIRFCNHLLLYESRDDMWIKQVMA